VAVPLAPETGVGLAAASGSAVDGLARARFRHFTLVPATEPGALLALPASDTAINLGWTEGEAVITVIQRLEEDEWSEITRFSDPTVTRYQDAGLQPATTYTYRLQALDTYGVGGYSEPASARTLIRLDELLATDGLVLTADQVKQPGARGSGLWFRSEGYLRNAAGEPLLSVWGVFNRTAASRELIVEHEQPSRFQRTFVLPPHMAAYVASPVVERPAQHTLREGGVVVAKAAAADETYVDERLVSDE
jgi:hypothetical protein